MEYSPLEDIPTEILSRIALHLSLAAGSQSPPYTLTPLLLTSKTIHGRLCLSNNSGLYAKIFASKFDTRAILRRNRQVNTLGIARELQRRREALKDLRLAVVARDIERLTEQDLWTIYMMIIENDGRNLEHLVNAPRNRKTSISPNSSTASLYDASVPTSKQAEKRSGMLIEYIRLYHEADLVDKAVGPGLPSTSVRRTLMLWIIWLLTSKQSILSEDQDQLEEFLFILRPYVFAAGHFDMFFEPWTIPKLPLPLSLPEDDLEQTAPSEDLDSPLLVKKRVSRTTEIEHYGQRIRLVPPVLSHAAMLNFFARVDQLLPRVEVTNVTAMGHGNGEGIAPPPGDHHLVVYRRPRRNSRYMRFPPLTDSAIHDQDYKRLRACIDPKKPGLDIQDWYGKFQGCWEGNFSFFDFDAYRSMLGGGSRALYQGQFGEQSQVWKLKEIYVRPNGKSVGSLTTTRTRTTTTTTLDQQDEATHPPTATLNAGFDPTTSAFDKVIPMLPAHVRRSSTVTNAVVKLFENDPTDQHVAAMLGGLEGYDMVSSVEVERIIKSKLETDSHAGFVADDQDIEIMLIGTGHSAWGEFLVRGRVRLWDGMATLVKEYMPDGRGRWIYRGYLLSGGIFVGRWRDCITPEQYIGYEGTFTLSKRVDDMEG